MVSLPEVFLVGHSLSKNLRPRLCCKLYTWAEATLSKLPAGSNGSDGSDHSDGSDTHRYLGSTCALLEMILDHILVKYSPGY
jgi:hypothetical protein